MCNKPNQQFEPGEATQNFELDNAILNVVEDLRDAIMDRAEELACQSQPDCVPNPFKVDTIASQIFHRMLATINQNVEHVHQLDTSYIGYALGLKVSNNNKNGTGR